MFVTVKHTGGLTFEGEGHSGEIARIAASTASSNNAGTSPMELILMGVAGCSGIDIVGILEKMRISYERFEMSVEGERAQEHPRVFTHIQVVYKFWGTNLPEEKIRRAIELSIDKYCSVVNMVNKVAQVSYTLELQSE